MSEKAEVKKKWAEELFKKYYSVKQIQVFCLFLYFLTEILLFIILTLLPIKVVFNWLLLQMKGIQKVFNLIILIVFTLHIYLYFNHKIRKII